MRLKTNGAGKPNLVLNIDWELKLEASSVSTREPGVEARVDSRPIVDGSRSMRCPPEARPRSRSRLGEDSPLPESEWIVIREPASHPFWSRDGRVLYYLATDPNVDIRSRVLARGFDPSTGQITSEPPELLTLGEMIVPAMVTGTAPVVAPDQIIFVLGNFRGDVWIREV